MKSLLWTCLLLNTAWLRAELPSSPLKVGDSIPASLLRTQDGVEVNLRDLVSDKPSVLIFYRGGWCPFCVRHLEGLAGIEKDLRESGAQLMAISMDQPSKLRETPHRERLSYQLLSDSDATAAQAFGIAFKVDDATFEKYRNSYQIDLEAASGRTHHLLPHPAVFVVDTSGVIRFAHVNPDYRSRLEPAKILAAARGMVASGSSSAPSAKADRPSAAEADRLAVVWSSGDPEVAHRVCLMYTQAAQQQKWFNRVRLIVWGPSARLLAADKDLQAKVKSMMKDGIQVQACVVCADSYGVSDRLRDLGLEVKPMGSPLSGLLKQGWKVITF